MRRLLDRMLADGDGGAKLEASMGDRLIRAAQADDGPAVFYVDNHLRPYTGKQVVRKGWRMQTGASCPAPRTTTSTTRTADRSQGSRCRRTTALMPALLPKLSAKLREALGADERIPLAFDRGAHAAPLAQLRDAGFEFVTYERQPYPEVPSPSFTATLVAGEAIVGVYETRLRNLGAGRGRVRRIAVLTDDGRQVNFLAVSTEPAARLIEILQRRWRQENGFKHGVERWASTSSTTAASSLRAARHRGPEPGAAPPGSRLPARADPGG
ncbi:MAG: hypothetical protein HS111_03690 [Kofleriaceae bacterium]|nr:hypothetical protein [Kofleriaceae bacterium]